MMDGPTTNPNRLGLATNSNWLGLTTNSDGKIIPLNSESRIFDVFSGKDCDTEVTLIKGEERDNILTDLFLGKEGKLDSSFLYKGSGAKLYERIMDDDSYIFINVEENLLESIKDNPRIKKTLETTETGIDFGTGNGMKVAKFFEGIDWNGELILADVSERMLEIAKKNIKKYAKHIRLGDGIVLNSQKHLTSKCVNHMYLFLGGTVCNMTDEEIVNILKNMDNNGIINGNSILISYYTAPRTKEEIQKLVDIYDSESNKEFHEHGMRMLGFEKGDFEYHAIYEIDPDASERGPFPGVIKGIIRSNKDQDVKLSNGETIHIKAGQEFTIHYSRRFSEEKIRSLFKESGCTIDGGSPIINDKGVSIALLKKWPTKLSKIKNKYKKQLYAGLAVLTLGAGMAIDYGINNHKATELKEQKEEIERMEYWHDLGNETRQDSDIYRVKGLEDSEFFGNYKEEQSKILMAEYNISSYNIRVDEIISGDYYTISNEILDWFSLEFGAYHRDKREYLTAERFMKIYAGDIINKYHIPYQKPYEHFKKYKDIINNTIKYGNTINIGNCKVEEIYPESKLSYYIEDTQQYYRLKILRAWPDNFGGQSIDIMVAEQNLWSWSESKQGNYNLKDGYKCVKDLSEKLGTGKYCENFLET